MRPLAGGLVPFDDLTLFGKLGHVLRVLFLTRTACLAGLLVLAAYGAVGFMSTKQFVVDLVSETLQLNGVSPTLLAVVITMFGGAFASAIVISVLLLPRVFVDPTHKGGYSMGTFSVLEHFLVPKAGGHPAWRAVVKLVVATERVLLLTVILFGLSLLLMGCTGLALVLAVANLRVLRLLFAAVMFVVLSIAAYALLLVKLLVHAGAFGVALGMFKNSKSPATRVFLRVYMESSRMKGNVVALHIVGPLKVGVNECTHGRGRWIPARRFPRLSFAAAVAEVAVAAACCCRSGVFGPAAAADIVVRSLEGLCMPALRLRLVVCTGDRVCLRVCLRLRRPASNCCFCC